MRNDIFGTDQAASLPGPGSYQSPENKGKGFVIGAKIEQKISDTPGPGNYDTSSGITRSREITVRMSQAKREDVFTQQTNKQDTPGPGAVDLNDQAWEQNGFLFDKEQRFPAQRNDFPGPGAYELLDD